MLPISSAAPAEDLKRTAIRGGATYLATRLLVQVFQWASTLIVARLLLPSDFGVMAAAMVLISVADLLSDAGLSRSLVHKPLIGKSDVAQVFTFSVVFAASLYLLLWIGAPVLAARFGHADSSEFMRAIGVLILMTPFQSVSMALLERNMRFDKVSILHAAAAFMQACTVLLLAFDGYGYWALGIAALASKAVMIVVAYTETRWPIKLEIPGKEGFEHLRYGISISLAAVVWLINWNADTAVIAALLGSTALGYYTIAFQLISIPVQKLTATINQVAFPTYCKLRDEPARAQDWIIRLMALLFTVSAPTLIGLALVADDVFPWVLGEAWRPAVLPYQLLSLVGTVMVVASCLPPWFNALGRPEINLKYNLVSSLVLPPAFAIGGYLGGLPGVCLAWLLAFPLLFTSLVSLTKSVSGISISRIAIALMPAAIAAVAMSAAVIGAGHSLTVEGDVLRLGLQVVFGAIVYIGTVAVLGRETLIPSLRAVLTNLAKR